MSEGQTKRGPSGATIGIDGIERNDYSPSARMLPDRIFVRETGDILGYEVSQVADPAGLAAVEPGWHEYVAVSEVARLTRERDLAVDDARDVPYVQVAAEQLARAEGLEAEVERLRVALEAEEAVVADYKVDRLREDVRRLRVVLRDCEWSDAAIDSVLEDGDFQ